MAQLRVTDSTEDAHQIVVLLLVRRPRRQASSRKGQVPNDKQNVVSVDCAYCDGENVVAPAQPGPREVDLTDREIACKYCRSLFTLSESKPQIRRLSKQEPGR
jgi:uncharacterized Zn-finger protein